MPFDFPASPTNGQQVTGADMVWIWDGVKWVASTAGNPFPVAPTPPVGDNDTSVATTAFVQAATATALTNVGRNLVHNAGFTVTARGGAVDDRCTATPLDRWVLALSPRCRECYRDTLRPMHLVSAMRTAPIRLTNTFTGNAGAAAFTSCLQRASRMSGALAGKTVRCILLGHGNRQSVKDRRWD